MLRQIKFSLLLLLLMLAGCRQGREVELPFLPGFGPHKIEIQQGNVVTQEMVEKLQPGMTRNQVRFVLGTPLIVDAFRNDRWDYVYVLHQRGARVEQRQLKVYFKDDRMVRYEGDVVLEKPAAAAAVKPGAKPMDKPVEKPAAPVAKPEPVTPEPTRPAQPTPAAVAPATAVVPPVGDPKLRLSPNEGTPAAPEERAATAAPAAPPAVAPAEPQALETPPLPRLQLPPEEPDKPAAPAPAKP